ncbi:arginine/serine-rich protein PNISR [Eurosta solidaginis]|uniref:arginine/serine-rich protein PNISR n=1 Tax=Eurosta solidaginis TaxID=178769 RepID=UPI00353155C0
MYSAGDSSSDGLSGLNQFAAMSGPIDWAAMAQQWIQMHDAGSFTSVPDAPPPPNISNTIKPPNMKDNNIKPLTTTTATTITSKKSFEEKGEADMDMDEDEEIVKGKESPPPPAPSMRLGKSREQTIMQSQQPWYIRQQNAVIVPPVTKGLAGIVSDIDNTMSQVATAASQWGATVWPPQINLPPPAAASLLNVPLNPPIHTPATHIPSLLKLNVPNPNATRITTPTNIEEQNSDASVVDAKKRKMLPAWIREGLEKMEREKQRQLEREQSKKRYESECSDSTSSIIGYVGTTNIPAYTVNMKYNQYAENDRSGNENEEEIIDLDGIVADRSTLSKKSNEDEGSGVSEPECEAEKTVEPRTHTGSRNYEDRLSEMMIVVRTTLTELLLEVTNQEIANLAQEAINAYKAKASSVQVISKSALSSITGKLGLAAYDDSTGDEISDSEDEARADSDKNNDSEEEIKASIRTKRRAFAKITDEIEEHIAANAAREEQKLKYYTMLENQEQEQKEQSDVGRKEDKPTTIMASTSSTAITNTVSKPYEKDFGETSETKLQHSNGKRQKDRNSRKERTTRFSDNKDSKGAAGVASSYISKITNSNIGGNVSSSTLLPITATGTTISMGMATATTTIASSPSIRTSSNDSSHKSNAPIFDSTLNKNLLYAAEAAYEKATRSRGVSTKRSSVSRSERERSHHSSHYDHKDHKSDRFRESERYERERKRDRYDERRDNKDRKSSHDRRDDSRERKRKSRHSSDEDYHDDKHESQTSSDTESSSSSSSSTSHTSSRNSRTSTTSKQRYEHEHSRHEHRDERKDCDRRSDRSRTPSRSRQRSRYHNQRSSSKRYSSAEDDYDNDSRYRHSSSRRHSSRKRSRSRSRSTYSSSSYRRRH